jgi:hypothetical protein
LGLIVHQKQMGFFEKIFGSSQAKAIQPKNKQRAAFKDAAFFNMMTDKKLSVIKMYQEQNVALKEQGKFRPVNNWFLAAEYLDLVYINYSMGCDMEACREQYILAADYYGKGWDADAFYADIIDMVALGLLLNVPDEVFEPVVNYIRQSDTGSSYPIWTPDALLWFIINSKIPRSGPQPDTLISEAYRDIYDLTKMPKTDAAREMKLYLDKWYLLHKNDPWYDNHKKERSYKGYWCWEAGAVTKIMGLDDSGYAAHPNYPYDMVRRMGL